MNYIFWIKVYNTIYIFWSYWNKKVIFLFMILFLLVHGTTGRCMFESRFLHLFFIEIYFIILNSYDMLYAYNDSMCVLNYYISFYKVIFIIYLPLKVSMSCSDFEPIPRGCELMQSRNRLCHAAQQKSLLVVHIWAYSFILTWIGNWMFSRSTCLNIYKLSKFFPLSFIRIYICKYLYIICIK